ncbi:hypothetical protein EC957_009713 [Mortierella hygrophila]|uniref:C2H2-type domain-containing protein n=1 Tax=Mortierella hygrophila TaxID=979708 RepID=A0A9P6FBX0_9FUNG|nr:hypothetical protein EC957_009713 [Mortierella hygrophila]
MFFHDTTSDLNKYPMNYSMFADNAMAMAAAPGCNSDMLPTEFIYPNYNLNQKLSSSPSSALHSSSSSLLTSVRTGSSNGLSDLSAGFMAHQQQQQQQPRPRGLHHHHSSTSSTSSSASSIVLDNAYLLSSSSTPVSTSSSLHSYSESSNAPFFLTSDASSSTSSTPSSSSSPISSTSSIAPNPALISTVTGPSSSSTSASAMDYMLTNQNSLLVQPHQQHQQQHYRQHQQIDHRPTARVQSSYPQHHNNNMQQQYVSFPANDFQGVPSSAAPSSSSSTVITPAVIVCSQQGPGTGPQQQQYSPWNIDMATSSNPTANAQLQLTSAPFISNPAKSTPTPSAATATASSVAWANESEDGGGGQTTHRSKQQQQQQQLHIMTSLDSGVASMYPNISGSHNRHGLVLSVAASLVSQQQQQPPCITSPAQQAAMSAHFQNQPQYQHHASWGMAATTSSPVDSCFNSGSSTPSFASSMSPTLSYSSFELGSSGDSSRATSPSRHNQHHHHHYQHHGTPYDAPSHFERRHRRRDSDASSSLIIRSRKSSTSSTSSIASQRRMSTLRESTLPSTPVSSSNNNATAATTTSVSSPTHQCPTCNLCFAGPAVLVRHIESIHDKLLWNCVGCKSNLSRRDAVTRHINLSPMDSVCRAVGTIGQIKMLNGSEVHYEISSYKAKPLDEVMNRMGKKISATLRQEIDRAKAMTEANNAITAASVASVAAEPVVSTVVAMGAHHHQYQQQHEYGFTEDIMARLREAAVADGMTATAASG